MCHGTGTIGPDKMQQRLGDVGGGVCAHNGSCWEFPPRLSGQSAFAGPVQAASGTAIRSLLFAPQVLLHSLAHSLTRSLTRSLTSSPLAAGRKGNSRVASAGDGHNVPCVRAILRRTAEFFKRSRSESVRLPSWLVGRPVHTTGSLCHGGREDTFCSLRTTL
jgi:hypothetical protein